MQGKQEARDKCWVAQNGIVREWMGSGVYEYSQIILNGVQKVQWNYASLMLLPLLCKELRAKADLGLMGSWQMEKLGFWSSYFSLEIPFPLEGLMQLGTINTHWNISAASPVQSVNCSLTSRCPHLPSQQIKSLTIGLLKYQALRYIIFPFAVTWDRQLSVTPRGFLFTSII